MADEHNDEWKERLIEALDAGDLSAVLALAEDIHYADLAAFYEDLDDDKRAS